MSIFAPSQSPWSGRTLSVLRFIAGLMFIWAGTTKLFGYPAKPVAGMPPIHWMSQIGIGALLETFGGLAVALGVLTRPVAFLLCGEMAVAYFQFHAPKSFFPTVNGGVPAVLYCFIFLHLVLAGAGPWSLDALIARRRGG